MIVLAFAGSSCGRVEPDAVDLSIGPLSTAVLAGGCFWCTEAVFEQLDGVNEVIAGYSGGAENTANYSAVSSGGTEHAEVIQVRFEPSRITYAQLLQVFFTVAHDPTQLNRQGPDTGPQYRSTVFYLDEHQKRIAEQTIDQLTKVKYYDRPIVTSLAPLEHFYPAESYHQDYVRHHPNEPYVVFNAMPKVQKLHEKFSNQVRP